MLLSRRCLCAMFEAAIPSKLLVYYNYMSFSTVTTTWLRDRYCGRPRAMWEGRIPAPKFPTRIALFTTAIFVLNLPPPPPPTSRPALLCYNVASDIVSVHVHTTTWWQFCHPGCSVCKFQQEPISSEADSLWTVMKHAIFCYIQSVQRNVCQTSGCNSI